jgi:predicted Holliday junction resolvase-like endonuclease
MDFFIRKDTTYSELVLELIKSSYEDSEKFFEDLQAASIRFSMYDVDTNFMKVANKSAHCFPDAENFGEYFISYKFSPRDVDTVGTFIGKFTITFNDTSKGKLTIPVKEDLKIHILK